MPPESVLTAPKEINFAVDIFIYFILGGCIHAKITMLFALFVLPIDIVGIIRRIPHGPNAISFPLVNRLFLFSFLLFLWGVPGYLLFLTAVTNQWYIQGDPLVEWHPLYPQGCEIFSQSFGGRLINGATCDTLRFAWFVVAVPVWGASFLSYLYLPARWKTLSN